jgi:coenzyme F420-reducing hydrogenase gamma subunit
MKTKRKPKLAVWKFASCDGCQLSLLDCEDELLARRRRGGDRHFVEASRAVVKVLRPFARQLDHTPHDAERITKSARIKTAGDIGACATAGGIRRYATSKR